MLLNKIDVAFVTERKLKDGNIDSDQRKVSWRISIFLLKFLISNILDKTPFYVMF